MNVSTLHPAFYERDDRYGYDEKYGVMFAEILERAGVTDAAVADASLSDSYGSVLDVLILVPNVADWQVRYRVQDAARMFEDEYAKSVVCRFRSLESANV